MSRRYEFIELPVRILSYMRTGSVVTLLLIGMGIGIGVSATVVAYVHRQEVKTLVSRIESTMSDNDSEGDTARLLDKIISDEEQKSAEKRLRMLFESAQCTFIHRNGNRFAGSIEELEPGFEVGTFGAVIHEDIWRMRVGASDEEVSDAIRFNLSVAKAAKNPYRFAIKSVRNLKSSTEDARTTCIVALPIKDVLSPALVMIAGPVVRDPQDFMSEWPIYRVTGRDRIGELRRFVLSSNVCDKVFCKWIGNEK